MLQWMASCGIAVMIVSVGLLCADDFDDYVWHGCDHRVIIVVGFLRDCCETMCDCCRIALELPWFCRVIAMVLPWLCCSIYVGLLWNCQETALGLLRDRRRIPVGWFEGSCGFVV